MMMRQAVLEVFVLLALLPGWCTADGLYAWMRNRIPENRKLQVRVQGSSKASENDSEARELVESDDFSEFWEDEILMIQSMPTAPPTTAPSSYPTFREASPDPTASPTVGRSPSPSSIPSAQPTPDPTPAPTMQPTFSPVPTLMPVAPTAAPVAPTLSPIEEESEVPTALPVAPSASPVLPTSAPITPFSGILSLQNTIGVCSGSPNGIGCSNTVQGDAGNPNDLVNCFNVTDIGGSAPFSLDTVRFWIGSSSDLPPDLSVRVWSANNGSPVAVLQEESISQFTLGVNTYELGSPAEIEANEFCVGLSSKDPTGGLRIQTDNPSTVGGVSSFVLSPKCRVTELTSLQTLPLMGSLCIEAFVSI